MFAASLLTGCAANAEFNPVGKSSEDMSPTQLAAFAATAKYPSDLPASSDMKAAAIVNRDDKTIKIYNFSDQPVKDVKVWVNRSFVAKVDGIGPQSKVTLKTDKLYGPFGNTFASQKDTPISIVQLQTADAVYTLQGPAHE